MKKVILLVIFTYSTFLSLSQPPQYFSVDIPNSLSLLRLQKQSLWCWAACNQMILAAVGVEESQENQVVKLFGQLVNQGAGGDYEKGRYALQGNYRINNTRTIQVVPYVSYLVHRNPNDALVIINKLANGIPVLMATTMHGRVCVGVDYAQSGQLYQITAVRLLDPAIPYGIVQKTMQEFVNEGLFGFMTVDIF